VGEGLPKWQILRPACQNGRLANLVPKQNIFFADFFCLTFKFGLVKYRYKEKEKERIYNE
jgi:hypothetical protein